MPDGELLSYRFLPHNLDAEAFERHDSARVIGEQADGMQAQVREDLRADAVLVLHAPLAGFAAVGGGIAAVGGDARLAARPPLDAEPGPGFVEVDQHARAFAGDGSQRIVDQPPAAAGGGVEHVAEHAARVHTHQHTLFAGHLAPHQRDVVPGVEMAGVNDGLNAPFALDLQSGPPAMA